MSTTGGLAAKTTPLSFEVKGMRRDIFRLVWPVTVENILQMAVGLVAMAMVGRLGATAIAAVGLVNRLTQLFWAIYGAIGTGTTILVARSVGASNMTLGRDLARTAVWLSLAFIAIFVVPVFWLAREALTVFAPQPDLLLVSTGYFRIAIWSVPFMVLTMLTSSVLRGKGDTRTPMLIALGINSLNVALQFFLIFGAAGVPAMGLNGSALAIVIAQGLGACVSAMALLRSFHPLPMFLHAKSASSGRADRPGLPAQILKIGIPAAMELILWQIGAFILTRLIVGLGRIPIAAHQLGLQAEAISYMPAAGFGIAATALVGQSLGARRADMAKRYISELIRWAVAVTLAAAAVLLLFPKPFLSLLTTDRSVINLAAVYLMLMGLAQSPQNIASVFNGALRASGDTRTPMLITFAGLWLIRLPLALVLSRPWGVVGVWIAFTLDLFIRFALALWRFLPGRWYKGQAASPTKP